MTHFDPVSWEWMVDTWAREDDDVIVVLSICCTAYDDPETNWPELEMKPGDTFSIEQLVQRNGKWINLVRSGQRLTARVGTTEKVPTRTGISTYFIDLAEPLYVFDPKVPD